MKRLAREGVFICLLLFGIVLLSLFQTFVYSIKTPLGFTYPLVHNYEQDYYWYLSLIRQGWDGFLLLTSKYTPEQFPRIFVHTYFPLSGMVARAIGINVSVMYLLLRIIFGFGLMIAAYIFIARVMDDSLRDPGHAQKIRVTAVLFMILGAPFWYFDHGVIRQVGEFWTGFDPLMRVTFLPHHLTAIMVMIFSILVLARSIRKHSAKIALAAGILGALGCWLNPASLITFILAMGVVCFIGVISLVRQGIYGGASILRELHLKEMSIWLAMCLIPFIILILIQNSTFPWTGYRDWERFVQYPITVFGYMGILGLVGLIGLLGVPLALSKRTFLWNFVVGWYFSPFIGLLAGQFLPVSNGRFIQGAGYIPSALLAALVLWQKCRIAKQVRYLLIAVVILFQIPSFVSSVNRQMDYVGKNMTNELVMVPNIYWDPVMWLSLHAVGGLIIAPDNISPLIVGFTPLRTFSGHPTLTNEAQKKQADLAMFYAAHDVDQNSRLIAIWRPEYIWTPPQGPLGVIEAQGYRKVYESPSVILYQK